MDDRGGHARLFRLVSPALEQRNRDRAAKAVSLDPRQKTSHLSKGQRTQLALICAICPEPELLVLDEPTSGLDPIVRREFIQTVIGAYQDGDPERRTVLVSTHLISEFEGLIDEFTIIDHGRNVLTLGADAAREQYQKVHARFATDPGPLDLPGTRILRQQGREIEVMAIETRLELRKTVTSSRAFCRPLADRSIRECDSPAFRCV